MKTNEEYVDIYLKINTNKEIVSSASCLQDLVAEVKRDMLDAVKIALDYQSIDNLDRLQNKIQELTVENL